jgi:hypothetical protein
MRYRFAAARLVALLIACPALPAIAGQTVTFNVPVNLSGFFPEVQTFKLTCSIMASKTSPIDETSAVTIPLQNGGYHGVVNVSVTVPDSKVLEARHWSCFLNLFTTGSNLACFLGANAPSDLCKTDPGAPLVTQIDGDIQTRGASVYRAPAPGGVLLTPRPTLKVIH